MLSHLWKCGGALLLAWLAGCKSPPPEQPPAPKQFSLSLVKDINTAVDERAWPQQFHTVGGTTFFKASDEAAGVELWKTDGTEAGTVRVKDVVPGPRASNPVLMLSEGGTLFFSTQDRQLWKSDGTEAGTVLLNDDRTGPWGPGALPHFWGAGGWVYFLTLSHPERVLYAIDGRTSGGAQRVTSFSTTVSGDRTQRWSLEQAVASANGTLFLDVRFHDSHATPQNTQQLWAVKEGTLSTLKLDMPPPGSAPAVGSRYAVVGDTLFFVGRSSGQTGLWRTDGTPVGTRQLKALVPYELTAVGGTLFFMARDDQGVMWLWKSDGTEAGTVPVKALPPNLVGTVGTWKMAVGGTFFFLLYEGASGLNLWKSDGTEAGTAWLGALTGVPFEETVVGGQLFFVLPEGGGGRALWRSDGTEAGTRKWVSSASSTAISELTAVGGLLFFRFDDGVTGQELWRSDGTEAGTRRVKDLAPGAASSEPSSLADANGTLLFTIRDGSGRALWKSDGTEAGTARVRALHGPTRSAFGTASTGESEPARIHDTLFFTAVQPSPDGLGRFTELWKSDGTGEGTVPIASSLHPVDRFIDFSTPALGPLVDERLFFQAPSGLWRTDGSQAGTVRVRELLALPDARIDWLRTLDKGAIASVYRSTTGRNELWRMAGASPDELLLPSAPSDYLLPLASLDGTLLMFNHLHGQDVNRRELWRTDGTAAGTVRLKAIESFLYQTLSHVQRAEDRSVLFLGGPVEGGLELWRTDGTEEGTVRLGAGIRNDLHWPRMVEAGGRVFFTTRVMDFPANALRAELWSTDGTVAGTARLGVFEESTASQPVAHGGKFYFWTLPRYPGPPSLLWTSDGTEAGTRVLGRFARGGIVGADECGPGWQSVGGALYFGADDGQSGVELWRTDGTEEGTVLVKDIAPGPASSGSWPLALFEDRLVFTASTAEHPHTGKLWLSDGTAEGTVLLKDEETGHPPFAPCNAVQVGPRLLLQAETPGEGRELWKIELKPD
jgi:ELWxxDGT repeat protein